MAKFKQVNSPIIVDAIEIREPTVFVDSPEEQHASPGDWEVRHADGRREILSAHDFTKRFEPYDIDDEIRDITDAAFEAHLTEEQLEVNEFVQGLRDSGNYRD